MDLRNYFSTKPKAKAGSANPAPAEKPVPAPEKKKPITSRRKVIIPDSEDEDEPAVEVQSKHFASSSSAPAATKPAKVEETVDPKAFFASAKSKKTSAPTTTTQSATPSKEKSKEPSPAPVKAKVQEEPEPSVPVKRSKKPKDDDFFEDDGDAEVIPLPKPRVATKVATKAASAPEPAKKAAQPAPRKRKAAHHDSEGDDAYEEEEVKESKSTKRQKAAPKVKNEDDMDVDEPEVKVEKPKAKFNPWMLKNKAGPSALGSKEIPVGKDNCLAGWAFVFTGELSSITREDAADLVKRYNGRVTGSPSGKTNFLVVGEEAGQSKIEKAKKLKIKTIDEDEFLDLIRNSPAKTEDGKELPTSTKASTKSSSSSSAKVKKEEPQPSAAPSPPVKKASSAPSRSSSTSSLNDSGVVQTDLWTTKYSPKQMKDLCGNNAAVLRLQKWLDAWYDNNRKGFKSDEPEKTGTFRAVLISGPPGIGKTSAAHLVAESLGYSVVEFNASDTRSKRSLDEQVRDLLDNQSLAGYFTSSSVDGKGKSVASVVDPSMSKKQVIIMDEVDGMAGGDRGGVAQLISFIKKTHVPIICICNDRQSPKVRSLVNSCFDMKFQRPAPNQVRARLMSILHREGRQIPPNVLDKLVSGSQSDIRQVLNMLSTWSLTKNSMNYDEGTALSKASEKYVALNVFQIAETLLQESSYRALSFADKFDVYFNDYQLAPLMIQENYIRMNPTEARHDDLKSIELMSKAADSLSDADLVDTMIHGTQQHWSLMPVHAAFSCVGPAFHVHGHARPSGYGPTFQFPGYLGKLSSANKYSRLMKDIQIRMRIKISADKNEVRQSYLPTLFPALTRPLLKEGVDGIPEVIELMDNYYLSKEDWDTILELGICKNDGKAVLDKIPTNVKSTFTRKYNQESHPQPFLKPTVATKGRGSSSGGMAAEEPDSLDVVEADVAVPDDEPEEDPEAESIEKDKNIKQKKAKGGAASKAKGKGKASNSRGKN
ncbi:hypothetical protein BGZ81_011702 [Podila clonocystis]|nr:hypothetical protein BGZ81_011702 [Podila clonocystis]